MYNWIYSLPLVYSLYSCKNAENNGWSLKVIMLNLWICRKDWNLEIWLAGPWAFQSRTLPCSQLELDSFELGEESGVVAVARTVKPSVLWIKRQIDNFSIYFPATYSYCFSSLISLQTTPHWISCHQSVIKSDFCLYSSGDLDKSALIVILSGHKEHCDRSLIASTDLFNLNRVGQGWLLFSKYFPNLKHFW